MNANISRGRSLRALHPYRLLMGIAVSLAVISMLLAMRTDSGASALATLGRPAGAKGSALAVRLSEPVQLSGYGEPIALTADPKRAGVWFIDSSDSNEAIMFWDASKSRLSKYIFGDSSNDLPFGISAGLAVTKSGIVWAGVDDTLLRLNPLTGKVSRIRIPLPPDDPALTGGPGAPTAGSPRLFDSHSVQSLAVDKYGDVWIAMSFTTSVYKFEPRSDRFTLVELPEGDQPNDLSALSSGGIAVGTTSMRALDVINNDGAVYRAPVDAFLLTCNDNTCVTSPDNHDIVRVEIPSVMSETNGAEGSRPLDFRVDSSKLLLGGVPTLLSDGGVIMPTTDGFDVVAPTFKSVSKLILPSWHCSTLSIGVAARRNVPSTTSCQDVPLTYVVDESGNVWFTVNFGSSGVYEIRSNTY